MRPDQALPLAQRLSDRLIANGDCLEWTGQRDRDGYGKLRIGSRSDGTRRTVRAHVLAYELAHGPVPSRLMVCHTCDNPACCRVEHLYAGTNQQNQRDSVARNPAHRARKTHCLRGHEYTHENTRVKPNGTRGCRTCHNERRRKSRGRS